MRWMRAFTVRRASSEPPHRAFRAERGWAQYLAMFWALRKGSVTVLQSMAPATEVPQVVFSAWSASA